MSALTKGRPPSETFYLAYGTAIFAIGFAIVIATVIVPHLAVDLYWKLLIPSFIPSGFLFYLWYWESVKFFRLS